MTNLEPSDTASHKQTPDALPSTPLSLNYKKKTEKNHGKFLYIIYFLFIIYFLSRFALRGISSSLFWANTPKSKLRFYQKDIKK